MKAIIRRIAKRNCAAATLVVVVTSAMSPPHGQAQQLDADQLEKMVDYAQCIRDNGYPEFPDPTPGGFQFRIDRGAVTKFQAAQQACRDKAPGGLLQGRAPGPEQMEAQVAFAVCMREKGVADFPDPSPEGVMSTALHLIWQLRRSEVPWRSAEKPIR